MPQPVRFLLVEDDEDHAELIRCTFQRRRLLNELEWVRDGEQALAFLRGEGPYANKQRPHVVLLDINLPKRSGLEILAEMKSDESLRTIPVVVVTTSEIEGDRLKAYEYHVNSYIVKPVDFERLQQMVDHLQMYWTICNEPPR